MFRVISPETREKMRLSKLGDKNPAKREEVRHKMSIAKKGKPNNSSTKFKKGSTLWIGRTHSEEARLKMSKAKLGKPAWNSGVPGKTILQLSEAEKEDRRVKRSWQSNKRNRVIKRLRVASLTHSFGEWETLKEQFGYICPCCKKAEPNIKLTEDHIVPLCKGGSDLIENIQPLCLTCNLKKHTKIVKY